MVEPNLIRQARAAAALSQAVLALRSGTSRPTLSAYERGRKAPTLGTAQRILGHAGFDLVLSPKVEFHEVAIGRGRSIQVPKALPQLPLNQAFATVLLPLHLNWSDRGRRYDLRDRRQRARAYEIILREGGPEDIRTYIDGALLIDLWPELILPRAIRDAWEPAVNSSATDQAA
jgi:transcriptional regulator with XRE-family HTH domain